jgi:ABC-type methionine transport system permease subunit
MQYEIRGGQFPVVICTLAANETMITESGSMVWMTPNMQMETTGGGLGKIAMNYGYYRYKYLIMVAAVILLILLVQIFQSVGTRLSIKADKRLKNR